MIYQEKKEIKICFWIFFFLLMTEGIIRRWLLPGLNNIFLVARDPFVLYVIYIGIKIGLLRDLLAKIMLGLSILCFLSALIFGHGNVVVALFGMRILLYYPFIYITAKVLSRDDILKVGKIFVLLIIPMTILCMVQFISPQSSFVNIGVGGDESGAGFGGALGYNRPPGIFTFTAALSDYYAISLSFLLYFLTNKNDARKMALTNGMLISSIIFFIISIPVSISRTHFVQTIIIFICYMFAVSNNIRKIKRIIYCGAIVIISITIISQLVPEIDIYSKVFMARFNGANTSEGGLLNSAYERSFGWAIRALQKTSLMGYGDGHFTNVGMKLLRGDTSRFTGNLAYIADATEMEWGRILCEDGLILGNIIIAIRFTISMELFIKSKRCLDENKDLLPWLLMPFAFLFNLWLPLRSPYHLGFCAIITISCMTVIQSHQKEKIVDIIKKLISREPLHP